MDQPIDATGVIDHGKNIEVTDPLFFEYWLKDETKWSFYWQPPEQWADVTWWIGDMIVGVDPEDCTSGGDAHILKTWIALRQAIPALLAAAVDGDRYAYSRLLRIKEYLDPDLSLPKTLDGMEPDYGFGGNGMHSDGGGYDWQTYRIRLRALWQAAMQRAATM